MAQRMPTRVTTALILLIIFVFVIGFAALVIVGAGAQGLDLGAWVRSLGNLG